MELRDIYHAEKQLVKALPKMAKAATDRKLQDAFTSHLEETKGHVERLDEVFEKLDAAKRGKRCEAMEGLIEEGRELIEEVQEGDVRDAGLITAAQKVEHYEMAAYGSLATFAKQLGNNEVASLLEKTLEEEKSADKKLNEIALGNVNKKAA
jgi:ferritin-like metal-binding protein YciE